MKNFIFPLFMVTLFLFSCNNKKEKIVEMFVYFGETDHVIPWQTDHLICWRTNVANAIEALSKVVI